MARSSVWLVFVLTALITYFYRAFPFVFFARFKVPALLNKIKELLPSGFMAILVVYCLKAVPTSSVGENLHILCGVAVTGVIHLLRRNTIISVLCGTVVYMVLVNLF